MFYTLPEHLRSYGLAADARTLLVLRKAVTKGLVKTLGDVYLVLKGLVVKDPREIGPYTRAYYMYFLNIDIENGDRLDDAIIRSETFQRWKNQYLEEAGLEVEPEIYELVDRFLDQVHLSSYDIQEIVSGSELFYNDDPDLEDQYADFDENARGNLLDKMADYSDLSLEELLERLEKIREQQRSRHSGGSHWIGTGGISPYGHGGAAKDGIRVGGTGGGKMARKVLGDQNYFPIDLDAIINDNNVDAALASIKGVTEESSHKELDVPVTIKKGLKRGGLFIPELKSKVDEKTQIIVMIDNGGYSMSPYIKLVRDLFKKMKTRFAHDLRVFYFHNIFYDVVYEDDRRSKRFKIERLLKLDKNYRVFIIGDAAMAPYELGAISIRNMKAINEKFKKVVWLNPEPQKYWHHTYTIQVIQKLVEMFPLSPRGIEEAVQFMNKKNK